jgi:uncharacterized C2H2 Zn-finger protein
MEQLCKCLNCDTVLFDQNPQSGATLHIINGKEQEMKQVNIDGEFFWACPICETDSYLIDL